MDALFIFSDDQRSELSAANRNPCPGGCEDSGDVMRRVSSANLALSSTLSFPPPVFLATA